MLCHYPTTCIFQVENPHESPEATVFYNIDLKVDHIVFSIAEMRDIHGEEASRFHSIAPTESNTKKDIEKMYPYWVNQGEQTEEITDEHLITLGKHQLQFLSSFKPKSNETSDAHPEIPPANRKSAPSLSAVQDTESQQRDNSTSEEGTELIQALIKSKVIWHQMLHF